MEFSCQQKARREERELTVESDSSDTRVLEVLKFRIESRRDANPSAILLRDGVDTTSEQPAALQRAQEVQKILLLR